MITAQMAEDVGQLFAMTQQLLTALGAWGLIGVFVTAIIIVRLGMVLIAMIRA
jgi:hypothetical protein